MSTSNLTAAAELSFATETEIYITADGQVIVADLPAELAGLPLACGVVEPCQITGLPDQPARKTETVDGA